MYRHNVQGIEIETVIEDEQVIGQPIHMDVSDYEIEQFMIEHGYMSNQKIKYEKDNGMYKDTTHYVSDDCGLNLKINISYE